MSNKTKRRPLTADELEAEHGAELPDREALSIAFIAPSANALTALHAAQTAAAPAAAEQVAPVAEPEA